MSWCSVGPQRQAPSLRVCTGTSTNIFINDTHSGKLVDGSKLCGTLGTHRGWDGIQGDLEKLRR